MRRVRYITLLSWMRDGLNLVGNELIVYAVIYGFSQDGASCMISNTSYFTEWTGLKPRAIKYILNHLEKSGYITRSYLTYGRGSLTEYRVNYEIVKDVTEKGAKYAPIKRGQGTTEKGAKNDAKVCKERQDTSYINKNIYRYKIYSLRAYAREEEYKMYETLFYFKNSVNPISEAAAFVRAAELDGWKDSKGRALDTLQKRLIWADGWPLKLGDKRTNAIFLETWAQVYAEALKQNHPIADKLLDMRISIASDRDVVCMTAPRDVYEFLEEQVKPENRGVIYAALTQFRRGRKWTYKIIEP